MTAIPNADLNWAPRSNLVTELKLRLFELFTKERRQTLGLIAFVWAALAALYTMPYLLLVRERLYHEIIISHVLVAIVGIVFSFLLLVAIAAALRRPSYQAFFWCIVSVLVASAALSTIDLHVFSWVHEFYGRTYAEGARYSVLWTGNFAVFMSKFAMIAVAFWTLETLQAYRKRDAELQRVQLAASEAQSAFNNARLAALRFQLNPHFLFNTLNSISALVVTNRNADAETMLAQLSEFLRITLNNDDKALQTLDQELETVAAYLAIEHIRFGPRLATDVICPSELREAEVPNFLLQPLVENSIKYGVANSDVTVTIRIEAILDGDQLVLVVEDDACATMPCSPGHGIGLRNVQDRLFALYGDEARLDVHRRDNGFLSIVRLPYQQLAPVS